jgi:hypothetical protein
MKYIFRIYLFGVIDVIILSYKVINNYEDKLFGVIYFHKD